MSITVTDVKQDVPMCAGILRRLCREISAATVVVFLLFSPYISQFLRVGEHLEEVKKGRNAFWLMWQPGDMSSLFACVIGIAAIAVIIRELLRAIGVRRLMRLWDSIFVLALGAGLLTNLWFHTQRSRGYHVGQFGIETQTGWVLLFAAATYSFARPESRLVLRCRQFCQILVPAVPIVIWQLMQLPTISPSYSRPAVSSTKTARMVPISNRTSDHPIYLFIFDEWSYTRTYHEGQIRPPFSNLAEFSAQATTFRDAHSPGNHTIASIPGILRATEDPSEISGLTPGFISNGRFTPASKYPSIFSVADTADYRKIMLQWGFASFIWLEDELDDRRSFPCYARADGLAGSAALHLYNAAFFWTDPWTNFVYEKLKSQIQDKDKLVTYRRIRDAITGVITEQPERTFAIFHLPLPHPPYIVNADGSYHGHDPQNQVNSNVDGYLRNLAYVDTLVGEFVKTLKSVGRFENSLLILTSDHSWRSDPMFEQPGDEILTHVPLIVKFPGQQQALAVDSNFHTCRLGELIAYGLRQDNTHKTIAYSQQFSID